MWKQHSNQYSYRNKIAFGRPLSPFVVIFIPNYNPAKGDIYKNRQRN